MDDSQRTFQNLARKSAPAFFRFPFNDLDGAERQRRLDDFAVPHTARSRFLQS
jgi:hypothetical protein